MSRVNTLLARIREIVDDVPGRMGVSARLIGKGPLLDIESSSSYGLASVYKVPLMATLYHKADMGEIELDRRLTLKEDDKSIGSDLIYFDNGTRLTVSELCFLMIVHSDNTATDMIHRFLGIDTCNAYMRELGLDSIDVYCPCREGFLVTMDKSGRLKGKSLGEISRFWMRISREERVRILEEVRGETRHLGSREFLLESIDLWGIASEKETKEDRDASQAIDNYGSPADIAKLLEMIATKRIAPAPMTQRMIELMLQCDVRDRLPSRIPDGVYVANKTGGMPGIVNDCCIVFASKKKQASIACLTKDVKHKDCRTVEEAMGEIGLAVYKAIKE